MPHQSNHEMYDPARIQPKDVIDASMISKNLFLGSYQEGFLKRDGLRLLGVTHILSIGHLEDMNYPPEYQELFVMKRFELSDHHRSRIDKYFDEAAAFIQSAISEGGKIEIFFSDSSVCRLCFRPLLGWDQSKCIPGDFAPDQESSAQVYGSVRDGTKS